MTSPAFPLHRREFLRSAAVGVAAGPAGMNARDFDQQHQRAELEGSIVAARRPGAGLKAI